uniref:Fatty acid hydroxylase domain-containing protein n=1 Tax=Brassica oleracea var. oleracea TaxID=109376 RepID=A0A0D3B5G6_BRAOL
MASRPGLLTEWPWTPLGSFKYLVLAPLVIDSIYSYATMRDVDKLLILVVMVGRVVHTNASTLVEGIKSVRGENPMSWQGRTTTADLLYRWSSSCQMWISFARYKIAKGTKRIVNKSIEFDQVDRERTWDDQVIFNTLVIYLAKVYVLGTNTLPFWRLDGVVQVALLHAGPVEFIYYWFHRALHHHFLYSRYHSHHHSSIVTEPITSNASTLVEGIKSVRGENPMSWQGRTTTADLLYRWSSSCQMWISFARYKIAKGTKRIVNKSIEFDQVDRERTWDDQVIFNTLVIYLAKVYVLGTNTLPFWRLDGVVQVALLHAGPVEFIYYWFHRALHHHFLYSRYHSHHHSSIVTEPITCT